MIEVSKGLFGNNIKYRLHVIFNDEFKNDIDIYILENHWNKSNIVNDLIRLKYSQDRVEAIINNHFLNIADWLNAKFKGEEVEFSDPDYEELQAWRKECKAIANDALAIYPEY